MKPMSIALALICVLACADAWAQDSGHSLVSSEIVSHQGNAYCQSIVVTNTSDQPVYLVSIETKTCSAGFPKVVESEAALRQAVLHADDQDDPLRIGPGRSHEISVACSPACLLVYEPTYCTKGRGQCASVDFPGFP